MNIFTAGRFTTASTFLFLTTAPGLAESISRYRRLSRLTEFCHLVHSTLNLALPSFSRMRATRRRRYRVFIQLYRVFPGQYLVLPKSLIFVFVEIPGILKPTPPRPPPWPAIQGPRGCQRFRRGCRRGCRGFQGCRGFPGPRLGCPMAGHRHRPITDRLSRAPCVRCVSLKKKRRRSKKKMEKNDEKRNRHRRRHGNRVVISKPKWTYKKKRKE